MFGTGPLLGPNQMTIARAPHLSLLIGRIPEGFVRSSIKIWFIVAPINGVLANPSNTAEALSNKKGLNLRLHLQALANLFLPT